VLRYSPSLSGGINENHDEVWSGPLDGRDRHKETAVCFVIREKVFIVNFNNAALAAPTKATYLNALQVTRAPPAVDAGSGRYNEQVYWPLSSGLLIIT